MDNFILDGHYIICVFIVISRLQVNEKVQFTCVYLTKLYHYKINIVHTSTLC